MQSAELVVKIGQLQSKLEEASAKGFVSREAMQILYKIEETVGTLLELATAEFWAAGNKEAA
ncbi:hypothetical protein [Paraburkholderia acidisoli]|uniref:Uncharacterized protein n=1 Tax=Paraburkholderia acidisoli TaxID=2571748 RepID=A0A7Z2GRS0_9BURK|nr:hypothetical protein [Paraburkholderia acidisoli]QGZ66293.1 hypothetical protein FAZ98_31355 [Paraburkholderia acidisoli]QGZ66379.1 hypothetical protein FAZ98_31840 [Paraburkholderia acidisoli]